MEKKLDKDLVGKTPTADQSQQLGELLIKLAELRNNPNFNQIAQSINFLLDNPGANLIPPVESEVPAVPAREVSESVSEENESSSETSHSFFEESQTTSSDSSSEDLPVRKPVKPKPTPKPALTPTVAVQVANQLKPKAPEVKRRINEASKRENAGSQRTPTTTKSKSVNVTSHYSPGGKTLFVESLTKLVVEKESRKPFVDSSNVITK